ncbi:MAG: TetR-like C-terminal domain-containing protein [Acidimicrobiia bacterium]
MGTQIGLDQTAVVDAAAALADDHGFRNVTLAMLASQLGMRSQSLYAHVEGIDGLRRQVALRGLALLGDDLREAVMARAGADALRAVADTYATFADAHPGLYEASLRAPGDDTEMAEAQERTMEPLAAVLRSYGVDGDELIHRYRVIWASIHGFVTLRQAGLMSRPVDVDESFARLVAMLCDDLALRQAPAGVAS